MMNLSLAAAAVLLGAKVTAAVITGSSAVYSDAAESVVHLLAAGFAIWAPRLTECCGAGGTCTLLLDGVALVGQDCRIPRRAQYHAGGFLVDS